MEGDEQLAVNAAPRADALLTAGDQREAQLPRGRREPVEQVETGRGVGLVELDLGGGEPADHLGVEGDEGGVDDGDAGGGEGAGEALEEGEVEVAGLLGAAAGRDEGIAAPVEAAGVAEVGDDLGEEAELLFGRRHVGLEEGAGQAGNGPVEEHLADAAEGAAEPVVVEQVGGVFGPHDDGVDRGGAELVEPGGELVGVVGDQVGAPGGADDLFQPGCGPGARWHMGQGQPGVRRRGRAASAPA